MVVYSIDMEIIISMETILATIVVSSIFAFFVIILDGAFQELEVKKRWTYKIYKFFIRG